MNAHNIYFYFAKENESTISLTAAFLQIIIIANPDYVMKFVKLVLPPPFA